MSQAATQVGDLAGTEAASGVPAAGLDRLLDSARTTLSDGLISDRVYHMLRQAIVSGELAPGQRIVESDVARRLGTSQAPVREAVKRLAHDTLVTSIPRRGSYVTVISREEAEHARALRRTLEGFSGRAAAARRAEGFQETLSDLVQAMTAAADAGDAAEVRRVDILFHRTVAAASGNPFVPRVWEILEPRLTALRVVADPTYAGSLPALAHHHAWLLGLLTAGDEETAAAAFMANGVDAVEPPEVSPGQ